MIATLWEFGHNDTQNQLAVILAWGSVAGSALQVGVQLPAVLRLLQGLRLSLVDPRGNVATVVRNFIPVFVGRGVPQISAYIDALLASLLPTGAVAALSYAQTLYTLPVSLYGMSTSAAELPVMSGTLGEESVVAETLRVRLNSGLAADCILCGTFGRRVSCAGRRHCGCHLPLGKIPARRHDLRLGDSCRRQRRPGCLDVWPVVLVDVLRNARHADAASLCRGASGADDNSRLPFRCTVAAGVGRRKPLGSRGTDHLRRDRLVAGIRAASTYAEPEDRKYRCAASLP
jgi:hypothetical protein